MFSKKVAMVVLVLFNWTAIFRSFASDTSTTSTDDDVNVAVLIEDYYPWVFFNEDTNQYEGFDIEVVEMIAEEINSDVKFTYLSPEDLLRPDVRDDFNLFVGRLYNTDNVKSIMYLTDNYTASDFVLWGHEKFYKKFNITRLDLTSLPSIMAFISNKTFAVGSDKKEYALLIDYLNDLSNVNFFSTQEQLFDAMKQDDLIAVDDWHYVLNLMESSKAEYLPFGRTINREDIDEFVGTGESIGVSLNDPEFYQKVNQALKEMKEDGSLKKTSFRYFGKDITTP